MANNVITLLNAVTVTGAGTSAESPERGRCVVQATGVTSSGSGAATIKVQGSVDGTNFDDLGVMSLTLGTAATSDSFAIDAPWPYLRGNVTAISGTGAAVTLKAGT